MNRSYALVPARRVIKTDNMYRIVRHPLYASYFVMFSGYVLVNASAVNVLVFVTMMSLLVTRLHREETHLMKDDAYRAYAEKTRHRLVPFVY